MSVSSNINFPNPFSSQISDAISGPSQSAYTSASSPWAKMFPEGATQQQMQQFINQYLKSMIQQIQQDQQRAHQASQQLQQIEEGNDPDS